MVPQRETIATGIAALRQNLPQRLFTEMCWSNAMLALPPEMTWNHDGSKRRGIRGFQSHRGPFGRHIHRRGFPVADVQRANHGVRRDWNSDADRTERADGRNEVSGPAAQGQHALDEMARTVRRALYEVQFFEFFNFFHDKNMDCHPKRGNPQPMPC